MSDEDDKKKFESAIRALQGEIASIGTHLVVDSSARQAYSRQVHALANELRAMATSGKISWASAAEQAVGSRNAVMEVIRSRSTPVGRAMAQQMKQSGKTLNELIARKTQQLFGKGTDFSRLTQARKDLVFGEIVKSAGKSNPRVTGLMKNLSVAGKGLIVLTVAISVYNIAVADDKVDAAKREVVIVGVSIAGGAAGGALAGLACGPGAPVCVTVGAFVGGALAAFGVSMAW